MTESQAKRPNRLANETSPYLLQHAYNPVDWYPWGQEALAKAREEDKPILLSIGYSACHWCHVMEHESFEDAGTARLMNEHFVSIKVDREERPDLDDIYMKSVQMMTGHGGWPMTVFLTPKLKPFFGGTYFPPIDRHGLPGFQKVLASVAHTYAQKRADVEESASKISHYLALMDKVEEAPSPLDGQTIEAAASGIIAGFDAQFGGFGSAPKFPQAQALTLLLRLGRQGDGGGKFKGALEAALFTLEKMAMGGIHDQIGGGFARYAVDRKWLVPHFEKMLYDNACLAICYLDGYLLSQNEYFAAVARNSLDFVLRELKAPQGGFYASLDADSEGHEGKFYVWTKEELESVLAGDEANFASQVFGVTAQGNFEGATTVLSLSNTRENLAGKYNQSLGEFDRKLKGICAKLLEERSKRVRPGRDEKILTSWNSLMISALVRGYAVLKDPVYLQEAKDAAKFILQNLFLGERLLRTWGRGQAKLNAFLDDYAYFIQALLDLASADTDFPWLRKAAELNAYVLAHFWDEEEGGFFFTPDDHEELLIRPKNFNDGPTPSSTSVAVFNLLRLSTIFAHEGLGQKAEAVLKLYAPYYARVPHQMANMICALDFFFSAKEEIVLLAGENDQEFQEMIFTAYGAFLPEALILVKDGKQEDQFFEQSPIFKGREALDNKATAFICRNYACEAPINNLEEFKAKIQDLAKSPIKTP